jgi:DNA-binding PadR family transcriptional regulator
MRITVCVYYVKPDKGHADMKELTLLEQIILTAIVALKEDAYGISIRKRAEKLTGKRLMYGTLYNALDQLLRKDYVTKTQGTTSTARGGRPRIYYALSHEGETALRASHSLQNTIWESIPDFLSD